MDQLEAWGVWCGHSAFLKTLKGYRRLKAGDPEAINRIVDAVNDGNTVNKLVELGDLS